MKKIIVLFCLGILLVNCSEEDHIVSVTVEETVEEVIDEVVNVSFKGDFVSAAHPTSGIASINENKSVLNFTNFKTDNGPKLLVYLSTDVAALDYVSLGDLKGIEGDFSYSIPDGTDIEKYKIVNIWCVDFLVSFGHAELKK